MESKKLPIQCYCCLLTYSSKFDRYFVRCYGCHGYRSTPVESLHTILLGPYKYLLKSTIPKLSKQQKEEILARLRAFSYSGFRVRLFGNVVRHHQSFVGRDYKAWAQMSLFVIYPYLSDGDKAVWLALSKVNRSN